MIATLVGLDVTEERVNRAAFVGPPLELDDLAGGDELIDDRRDPPRRETQAMSQFFDGMRRDAQTIDDRLHKKQDGPRRSG